MADDIKLDELAGKLQRWPPAGQDSIGAPGVAATAGPMVTLGPCFRGPPPAAHVANRPGHGRRGLVVVLASQWRLVEGIRVPEMRQHGVEYSRYS